MVKEEFEINIADDIASAIKKHAPKKRVNSIKKGHNFERKMAKILTEEFNVQVERVPMSGGFGTMKNTSSLSGDLFAPNTGDFFPFEVECKHHNSPNIIMEILNKKKKERKIISWINQSNRDAKRVGKIPYIIFRINNSPILNIINAKYIKVEKGWFMDDFENKIFFQYKKEGYIITPFDNFKLKEFYEYLKKS